MFDRGLLIGNAFCTLLDDCICIQTCAFADVKIERLSDQNRLIRPKIASFACAHSLCIDAAKEMNQQQDWRIEVVRMYSILWVVRRKIIAARKHGLFCLAIQRGLWKLPECRDILINNLSNFSRGSCSSRLFFSVLNNAAIFIHRDAELSLVA